MKNSIAFMENVNSAMRGFEIANRIVEDDPTVHYLVMNRHMDDDFRMLRSIVLLKHYYTEEDPYYKEEKYGKLFAKNRIIKKVVVITDEAHAALTKIFNSVDGVIVLPKEDVRDINIYAKSYICVHNNLHRDEYGSDIDRTDDLLKSKLYHIPSYNWVMDLPVDLPGRGSLVPSAIRIGEESLARARDVLYRSRAWPEKSMIFCPFAQSSSLLSPELWTKMADIYRSHGFTIYTNLDDDPSKHEVAGTLPLRQPVDMVLAMVSLGAITIAVQSGLADVLRSMEQEFKLIVISVLNTTYDEMIAKGRNLSEPVEHRENTTHILYRPGEERALLARVDEQVRNFERGNEQYARYLETVKAVSNSPWTALYQAETVKEYLDIVLSGRERYLLFLSVSDSANKYWTKVPVERLGIKSDLSDVWRKSFLAVYDTKCGLMYEEMASNNKKLVYNASVDQEQYYITSHAMGRRKYTKAVISINGQNYARNGRGLNMVVFDCKHGHVIDSVYVDLWADPTLTIKRG